MTANAATPTVPTKILFLTDPLLSVSRQSAARPLLMPDGL
jgi:hypothetical protein